MTGENSFIRLSHELVRGFTERRSEDAERERGTAEAGRCDEELACCEEVRGLLAVRPGQTLVDGTFGWRESRRGSLVWERSARGERAWNSSTRALCASKCIGAFDSTSSAAVQLPCHISTPA